MRRLGIVIMLTLLTGCMAAPQTGTMRHPAAGQALDRDGLDQMLARAQVVLVGETHDHPEHHRIQLEVLTALASGDAPLVVGVEWLDQTRQDACDQLCAREITVDQFAKLVDWQNTWGYPFAMFRPIFALVRAKGLKLVAMNAPRKLVRQVGRGGLGSLGPAQRGRLARSLDLDDTRYRKMVAASFGGHGVVTPAQKENFFAAQVVRDETMARNLARALEPWPDSGRRAVVFAGGGHMAHGLGLPPRIARRLPGVRLLTILPMSRGKGPANAARMQAVGPAQVVIHTGPGPRQRPRRPMLGIFFSPRPQGLLVRRVATGSPAAKAGIMPGDLITEIDGKALKSAMDIHRAIRNNPHGLHAYQVRRKGKLLKIDIAISKTNP